MSYPNKFARRLGFVLTLCLGCAIVVGFVGLLAVVIG